MNFSSRNVVDFKTNKYGNILIDFLINANYCILNGRNYTTNDFTSVSTKGCSVVDYCLVSHSDLSMFSDFHVTRVTELISRSAGVEALAPTSFPDHSVLSWSLHVDCNTYIAENTDGSAYDKFDISHVPDSFLFEHLGNVNQVINDLESSIESTDRH